MAASTSEEPESSPATSRPVAMLDEDPNPKFARGAVIINTSHTVLVRVHHHQAEVIIGSLVAHRTTAGRKWIKSDRGASDAWDDVGWTIPDEDVLERAEVNENEPRMAIEWLAHLLNDSEAQLADVRRDLEELRRAKPSDHAGMGTVLELAAAARASEKSTCATVPPDHLFIRAAIVVTQLAPRPMDRSASAVALIANTFWPDIDGETLTADDIAALKAGLG